MSFTVIRKNLVESLVAEVIDLRVASGVLQYTFDGETWDDLAELGQVVSAVAETLNPGQPAYISLVDGILTIGVPRGADGADGADGANGFGVLMRVDGGWVQWARDDGLDNWTNLYQVPSGETGEEMVQTKAAIYAEFPLHSNLLVTPDQFVIDFTAWGEYDRIRVRTHLRSNVVAAEDLAEIMINADTAAANYHMQVVEGANGTPGGSEADSLTYDRVPGASSTAAAWSDTEFEFIAPRSTIARKNVFIKEITEVTADHQRAGVRLLVWQSTSAIDTVTLRPDGYATHKFEAGSYITVTGLKAQEFVTNVTGTGVQGAAGADGAPAPLVMMQAVTDESGNCQAIQWKYEGDEVWTTLVTTPICDPDDQRPANLQMNRCGVAVAVVNDLHRMYTRFKTEPTVYDGLEDAATLVSSGGNVVAAAAVIASLIVGAPVVTGVALFGGAASAAGTIINWLSGTVNPGADNWTSGVEEYLVETLYCVLTRRETVTINADVLREWMSYINDAPIVEADREFLIIAVSGLPVSYWFNSALVAQPNINDCLNECTTRTGDWCSEIGTANEDTLLWYDPIVRAQMSLVAGRIDDLGDMRGVGSTLDTLVYHLTFKFGRLVTVGGIDIGVTYRQSVDVNNPAIIGIDNLGRSYGSTFVSGISGAFDESAVLNWRATETTQFSEFTITGKVSVEDVGALTDEFLRVDYVRFCGNAYAPYGEAGINCEGCADISEPEPCDEMYGADHCVTFKFDEASACWGSPQWNPGWGLVTQYGQVDGLKYTYRELFKSLGDGTPDGAFFVVRTALKATYAPAAGSNNAAPLIRLRLNAIAQIDAINQYPVVGLHEYIANPNVSATTLELFMRAYRHNTYPNNHSDRGGEIAAHELTVWYNGTLKDWGC